MLEVAFVFLQMLTGKEDQTSGMNRSLTWLRASKRSCGRIHNSDTKITDLQHSLLKANHTDISTCHPDISMMFRTVGLIESALEYVLI